MSYCNAEGAPRKLPYLQMCSRYQFYIVKEEYRLPEFVKTFGDDWLEDWIVPSDVSFRSIAGPRVLIGCPGYKYHFTVEEYKDDEETPYAWHVVACRKPLEIRATQLPYDVAIEWVNQYLDWYTGDDPSAMPFRMRISCYGAWQPELISLLGPEVLTGGAR